MNENKVNEIDRISHNIRSLAKDMNKVKKTIMNKEIENKELSKKIEKRKQSLKKAQKNFFNVSTNLKKEEFEEFEKRFKDLKLSKSAYLKKLIMDDIKKDI